MDRWLPCTIDWLHPSPRVQWVEVGDDPLDEPFLEQAFARLARARPAARHRWADLDSLLRWRQAPAPPLLGLVFHMSRCGSTALASALRATGALVVHSEPRILNQLLRAPLPLADRARLLRGAMQALGQPRTGRELGLVVKLSSWTVLGIDFLLRLWPRAKPIFVYRDPTEVLMSWCKGPPRWLGSARPTGLSSPPMLARAAALLDSFCRLAAAAHARGCRLVSYRDLGQPLVAQLCADFGTPPSAVDQDAIARALALDAKDPRRPFRSDSDRKQRSASAGTRQAAARIRPSFDRLERLRLTAR